MIDEKAAQNFSRKILKIEWPDVGIAAFANNVTAQFDGSMIHISFFQVNPPMIIGTTEQEKQQLEQVDTVKALPIANVVMTLDVYRRTIQVFQENLNRIEKIISNDTSTDASTTTD